jgi:hypothetical protein
LGERRGGEGSAGLRGSPIAGASGQGPSGDGSPTARLARLEERLYLLERDDEYLRGLVFHLRDLILRPEARGFVS